MFMMTKPYFVDVILNLLLLCFLSYW